MFNVSELKDFKTNQITQVKGSFGGGGRSFSAPRVSVPRMSSPAPRVSVPVAPRVSQPRVSTPVNTPRVVQPRNTTVINNYHGGYGYHPYYSYYGYHPYYYYAYHPGYWFSYNFWNYMWFSSVMNQQQVVQQQYSTPSNGQSYPQTSQTQEQPQPYPQLQEDTNYTGWAIALAIIILGVFWWTRRS